MIAKKLKLYNFYSHTNTELIFDQGIYIILGKILGTNKSNGSGKSSICRALCYALYGDSTESEKNTRNPQVKSDGLIYNNETNLEVSFEFEMNNNDYEIRRVLRRGNTATIDISKNGEKPLKYGVKEGQAVIENIIGASYEIFKNTSYFQQGDLNSFSKLTPKAAKDVVMDILQLSLYKEYEQSAKDRASLARGKLQELVSRANTLKEMIEKQEEAKTESKYTEKDLKEVESQINEVKFHKQLQTFWEQSKNMSIDFIEHHREAAQKAVSKIEAEINIVEQRVRKLARLSGTKICPTCEQELKKEDIESIVKILKADIVKRAPKKTQLKEALDHFDKSKNQIRSYSMSLYDEDSLIENKEKLFEIKTELKQAKAANSKLKDLGKTLDKVKKEIKEQKNLLTNYKKLQETFGRKGIPAYIIENVIPEIEETANDILKSLETRIRIAIESQKDLKKGGKAETLDINVITEYGERPYANYSGGERTFIDFAIRMALSIILARRSNCQIQTLILDEMFGELDTVNRQIISKAIKYISNKFDFKRIFVISHCEELQSLCKNVIKVIFDGKKSYVK